MRSKILAELITPKLPVNLYNLAWQAYTKLEMDLLIKSSREVSDLEFLLSKLPRGRRQLHTLLYNKQLGIGVLLSCYVLKSMRILSNASKEWIHSIINTMKKFSWYDLDGETLFVLSLVIRGFHITENAAEIWNKIGEVLEQSLYDLRRSNITLKRAKDILFLIWSYIKSEVGSDEELMTFLRVLSDEHFMCCVEKDTETFAIYSIVLSELVKRVECLWEKEEINGRLLIDAIKERVMYIHRTLNALKYEVDKSKVFGKIHLIAKIELALHEADEVRQKLIIHSEIEKLKRKCCRIATVGFFVGSLITMLHGVFLKFIPEILFAIIILLTILFGLILEIAEKPVRRFISWLLSMASKMKIGGE